MISKYQKVTPKVYKMIKNAILAKEKIGDKSFKKRTKQYQRSENSENSNYAWKKKTSKLSKCHKEASELEKGRKKLLAPMFKQTKRHKNNSNTEKGTINCIKIVQTIIN